MLGACTHAAGDAPQPACLLLPILVLLLLLLLVLLPVHKT
jgi:hypothetical protein